MSDKQLTVGQIHQLSVDANPEIERLHNVIAEYSEKYSAGLSALSELVSLRSQVAELQRQLSDAAKHEPITYLRMHNGKPDWAEDCIGSQLGVLDGYDSDEFTAEPLYAHPPNLPAMIEQARAEEREAALKPLRTAVLALAHALESNPSYRSAYDEVDAAIRAMVKKK